MCCTEVVAAAAAALGGNLGGITSWLFSLDGGQLAAATRADIIVPVNGFKRCFDAGYGFGESLASLAMVRWKSAATKTEQLAFCVV
jgi:hypothetical protein